MPARLLYSLLLYLLLPAVLLRLCWRARRAPDYARRRGERFGWVAPLSGPVIWVHAVSVGETLAAAPLIRHLRTHHPHATLLVTTTTPTGSQRVRALFGTGVAHCYAPYDFPDAVARFLRRVQPALLVIMETELWPNLLHACAARGIPVVLANARLSARSARGYAKVKLLTAPMLRVLTRVAAQTSVDGQRLLALGLAPDKLRITGNLKFDLDLSPELRARAAALHTAWAGSGPRPVWLAASTHAGEDEPILAAHAEILRVLPAALLVLVPRHPERFAAVEVACRRAGFTTRRRSEAGVVAPETQVLLGDTMGELLMFCGAADVVFVGGSLVPVGGHNLIEPAAWGRPVLAGPHLFNFAEAAALLLNAGGLRVCSAAELASAVIELLTEPDHRATIGAAARAVAEANRGALARLAAVIEPLCPP